MADSSKYQNTVTLLKKLTGNPWCLDLKRLANERLTFY